MHESYEQIRVALLASSAILLALSSASVWRSRSFHMWTRGSHLDTTSKFQLCALFGSLFATLLHVDFFGAFGIYGVASRVSLHIAMILVAWIVLCLVFHYFIVDAMSFVPDIDTKRSHSITASIFWIYGVINFAPGAISKFYESREVVRFARFTYALWPLLLVVPFWWLYSKLKDHCEGSMSEGKQKNATSEETTELLKTRLKFTVTICSVLVLYSAMSFENLITNWDDSIDNMNFSVDYSAPPQARGVLSAVVNLVVFSIVYWKSSAGSGVRSEKMMKKHVSEQ